MKLPKLKLSLNIKPLLNYILIIIVTSLFLATLFVALPLTEKYVSKVNYNLTLKNGTYWSEEYVISAKDTSVQSLDEINNIFFKRLKGFGVEEVSASIIDNKIHMIITSSKDKSLARELLANRFSAEIVTRKADVNFDDSSDQYAYIYAKNYDATEWDRSDFRNVYITKLKTNSGEKSYFAIFKLWPNKVEAFNAFLKKYNGQYIGVNLDGFVTPYSVDTTQQVFAIPISTEDAQQIKVMSLLYNSGLINTDCTIESETEIPLDSPAIDYIGIAIAIAASIIIMYTYLVISKSIEKPRAAKALIATILSASLYIAFLKIFNVPVDLNYLAVEMILLVVTTYVLSENKDSHFYIELFLLILLASTIFLASGALSQLAQNVLLLAALSKICLIISGWYLNKIKKI